MSTNSDVEVMHLVGPWFNKVSIFATNVGLFAEKNFPGNVRIFSKY